MQIWKWLKYGCSWVTQSGKSTLIIQCYMFDLTFPLHNIAKQVSLICAVSWLIVTNQTQNWCDGCINNTGIATEKLLHSWVHGLNFLSEFEFIFHTCQNWKVWLDKAVYWMGLAQVMVWHIEGLKSFRDSLANFQILWHRISHYGSCFLPYHFGRNKVFISVDSCS